MKQGFVLMVFLFACFYVRASHITGGEMYYELVSSSGSNLKYRVHMKLFMRCNSGRQFNNPAIVSIFSKNGSGIKDVSVPLDQQENISLPNNNKCITNPPVVCY